MNKALTDMLNRYDPVTSADWVHAIREVVQEIALLGFWRNGFFEHAAFYGGTALRIFHGLERFSEDLDFTLLQSGDDARLESALVAVRTELAAWGFSLEAEPGGVTGSSGIESAFLKGNTRINLLNVGVPAGLERYVQHNQKISIKLELDTTPPGGVTTEVVTHLLPTPFQVRLYDLPSLFAGKLHAVLYRNWKTRVKGRDFYDFVWYISRGVAVNLDHLSWRIEQSGDPDIGSLTVDQLKERLKERFSSVDLKAAADEVRPFLRDPRETALWSKEFFIELTERLEGKGGEGKS